MTEVACYVSSDLIRILPFFCSFQEMSKEGKHAFDRLDDNHSFQDSLVNGDSWVKGMKGSSFDDDVKSMDSDVSEVLVDHTAFRLGNDNEKKNEGRTKSYSRVWNEAVRGYKR